MGFIHLSTMFRVHDFQAAGIITEKGLGDVALFEEAKKLEIDVFITSDIKQIESSDRSHERKACRDAGIHWIGVPKINGSKGRAKPRGEVASLLGSLTYIEKYLKQQCAPQAILLTPGVNGLACKATYPQDL